MKPVDPIVIAMCSDNNGADFMQVAIKSIFINNKDEDIELHIITDGFDEEVTSQLKSLGQYFNREIKVHAIDSSKFYDLPGCGDGFKLPKAACFRFLVPDIISGDKVLYLDTDIVVEQPLRQLWSENIIEYAAGVILDPGEYVGWDWHIKGELSFSPDTYFNSGVMLMNLDYFRRNEIGDKCINWLMRNPDKSLFVDQTALNVVLSGRLKYLPAKFNLQHYYWNSSLKNTSELLEARKNPVIIHYTIFKPWEIIGIPNLPKNKNRFEHYRDIEPKIKVKEKDFDNHVLRRRIVWALYKLHLFPRTPSLIQGLAGFDRRIKNDNV